MTQNQSETLYDLIREIRLAFNRLRTVSDAMNEKQGVTAAMRAVLEHLDQDGPATVPQIARVKSVSRQNIQLLADALAKAGLARFAENPGHKRSRLLEITADGRAAFADIRSRESHALHEIGKSLDPAAVAGAAATLHALNDALGSGPVDPGHLPQTR